MERTETMITPTELFGEGIKYLTVAAIGWLVSNFSQQRKFDDFERRIVGPLRDEVAIIKSLTQGFATRAELKAEMASLRGDFKEGIAEVKQLIREFYSRSDK